MIHLTKADITTLNVDVIVNAANDTLLGGGGVDGAIHRAAGKELLEECRTLNGCQTGGAKITGGYNLKAKHIIHTVGPVWEDKYDNNPQEAISLLTNCYENSLKLAEENKLATVAFPCISTGVYRFPNELAADVAIKTVRKFLKTSHYVKEVTVCCFLDKDVAIYEAKLSNSLWKKFVQFFMKTRNKK